MSHEKIGYKGIISLHEIPNWTDEELAYWWTPETALIDGLWQIVRPARMSEGEKRSRLVMPPFENLITNTGITLLLTNNSVAGQGSMNPFAQILSVGNGTITGVTRGDTSVAGDGFTTGARKAPASYSIVGFSTTIVFNFASTDAVGTWTNTGLYGWSGSANASTTSGTGSLMTHALFSYTKNSTAIAVNYAFLLSN